MLPCPSCGTATVSNYQRWQVVILFLDRLWLHIFIQRVWNEKLVEDDYPHLLAGVGKDDSLKDVENLVSWLYGAPNPQEGVDQARHDLFEEGQKDLERLPPTKDALQLHAACCNYQAKVLLQGQTPNANCQNPARDWWLRRYGQRKAEYGMVQNPGNSRCIKYNL